MYTVLVADDNSNIQKMVTLALRDHDIEVVAVGNGEAAVRKLAEFRPHLILADVFMPVRNGYEVCEFVKKNSGLSEIPVILLVGAFDPLDEEEVRRVGADGVLKKPFVPPDPLISLVKSLLASLPQPAAVPAPARQAHAPASQPVAPAPAEGEPQAEETPVEEFGVRAERFEFPAEDSPLAFRSLLESEAAQEETAEQPPSSSEASSGAGLYLSSSKESAQAEPWSGWDFGQRAAAEDSPAGAAAEVNPPTEVSPQASSEARLAEAAEKTTFGAPRPHEWPEEIAAPPADPAPEEASAAVPTWPAWETEWSAAPELSGVKSEISGTEAAHAAGSEQAPLPGAIETSETPSMRHIPEIPAVEPVAEEAGAGTEKLIEPVEEPPEELSRQAESFSLPQPPEPALVESVVDQLVERLRPQIEQATREVLRPVAEQLLQRELEKWRQSEEAHTRRERVRG